MGWFIGRLRKKGRITIPRWVREWGSLKEGDWLEIEVKKIEKKEGGEER